MTKSQSSPLRRAEASPARPAAHSAYRSARLLGLAGLALSIVLSGCGSDHPSIAHIDSSATIWFHPLPTPADWPGEPPHGGSTDFLALFQNDAPWQRVATHTQAFGVYADWIVTASDQELQTVVTFLNARHIGFEIEAPALQALPNCGSGVEGYIPYGLSLHDFTLTYLQRLKALHAEVPFLKVDEPFFYGNVVGDPRSCHFSVAEVARQVGVYTQLVKTVYPDAAIGDVEPVVLNAYVPDVPTALGQWHDTYRTVNGVPLPFYFADIDFTNPGWPSLVKTLEDQTRQRGMRFGIIYIGDYPDSSDLEWSTKATARFETYQGPTAGHPDYVLFQSWEPYPQLCLPESNPLTFTGVINNYLNATQ